MTIRIDLFDPTRFKNVKTTDAGFVRVPVFATRTGVFTYQRADGEIVRELRHPDDVFNKDSLNTFMGIPLTSRHPTELVNTKNAKMLSVGHVSDREPRKDGIFLASDALITDADAIKEVINDGVEEVSCGYECDVIQESGIFEREDGVKEVYDARQKNIRYNHLAIVPRGRAGSSVRFRLDSSDAIQVNKDKENIMKKIKIDGVEFEVTEEVAKAYEAAQAKNDEAIKTLKEDSEKAVKESEGHKTDAKNANSALETTQAKVDSLETDKKALQTNLDEAKKNGVVDAKKLDEMAQERASIIETAKPILGEDFKFDGIENKDIKKSVVAKISPDLKMDEKSEVYIEARFDHIAENKEIHKDHLADAINKKKQDEEGKKVKTEDELKIERRDNALNAHKSSLSMSKE